MWIVETKSMPKFGSIHFFFISEFCFNIFLAIAIKHKTLGLGIIHIRHFKSYSLEMRKYVRKNLTQS